VAKEQSALSHLEPWKN